MTTLYSCKSEIDAAGAQRFRITKFDSDFNVESSYLTDGANCTCPAGERPTCRHRTMLPRFLARNAVNSMWMHDYDRSGWVSTSLEVEFKQDIPEGYAQEAIEAEAEFQAMAASAPRKIERRGF